MFQWCCQGSPVSDSIEVVIVQGPANTKLANGFDNKTYIEPQNQQSLKDNLTKEHIYLTVLKPTITNDLQDIQISESHVQIDINDPVKINAENIRNDATLVTTSTNENETNLAEYIEMKSVSKIVNHEGEAETGRVEGTDDDRTHLLPVIVVTEMNGIDNPVYVNDERVAEDATVPDQNTTDLVAANVEDPVNDIDVIKSIVEIKHQLSVEEQNAEYKRLSTHLENMADHIQKLGSLIARFDGVFYPILHDEIEGNLRCCNRNVTDVECADYSNLVNLKQEIQQKILRCMVLLDTKSENPADIQETNIERNAPSENTQNVSPPEISQNNARPENTQNVAPPENTQNVSPPDNAQKDHPPENAQNNAPQENVQNDTPPETDQNETPPENVNKPTQILEDLTKKVEMLCAEVDKLGGIFVKVAYDDAVEILQNYHDEIEAIPPNGSENIPKEKTELQAKIRKYLEILKEKLSMICIN